jgi:hypothetical protein
MIDAISSLEANCMARRDRDWRSDPAEAWIWGICVGWSDVQLAIVQATHGWSDEKIETLRRYRAEFELARVKG